MEENVKKVQEQIDQLEGREKAKLSDGYHSFDELYEFRKFYNALVVNTFYQMGICSVEKSKKHHDGELCFGGGWFVVVMELPTGQVTNHYRLKDWDLFQIPEVLVASRKWDGHTSKDSLYRMEKFIKETHNLTVGSVSYGKKLLVGGENENPEYSIKSQMEKPLIHLTNQTHDYYNRKRNNGRLTEFDIFHYNKSMMEISNLNSSLKNLTRNDN